MATAYYQQTLTSLTCWVCGIHFAMPEVIERKRAEDGKTFYCPNGDKISYGPSLLDTERARIKRLEARAIHAEDQRRAAERQVTAYKGQITKIKKRAANGICPCCHRTFVNVARHMATKHPDYADSE